MNYLDAVVELRLLRRRIANTARAAFHVADALDARSARSAGRLIARLPLHEHRKHAVVTARIRGRPTQTVRGAANRSARPRRFARAASCRADCVSGIWIGVCSMVIEATRQAERLRLRETRYVVRVQGRAAVAATGAVAAAC